MDDEYSRFLLCHDYGMGSVYRWLWARSAKEIDAWVDAHTVITDPEVIREFDAKGSRILEARLDDPASLEAILLHDYIRKRPRPSRRPQYWELPAIEDCGLTLLEVDAHGRLGRQLEQAADGSWTRVLRPAISPDIATDSPEWREMARRTTRRRFDATWATTTDPTAGPA